ncbi:MAG TPA: DUF1598 domain-containing protein [Planctomycetaceae bacterium]|nr:DUF1598 domain-containing protein [Planctomycetaceae bacterium]
MKRETQPAVPATVYVAAKSAVGPTAPQTAADRAKLVQVQIASGEFGPALQTARSATEAVERTDLLKTIADAQLENGDLHAADLSISRMPIPESRDEAWARAQNSSRESAAGGAAQAAQLVNLIKQTTGDPDEWTDEAARKQPIYWPPGIEVDPNGLLRGLTHQEQGTVLSSLGHRAREADLNTDLRTASSLRLVSLTRLEKEVSKRLAQGRGIPETMQHLAGLSHVRYVIVDPDQHDVVIGGPAEGWRYNEQGIAVGRESGKAALFLDDFVTVLRTFAPRGPGYFNCQIVPREEGLRRIQQFVEESHGKGPLDAAAVGNWTKQLQQQLGLQDVEINGVPDDSRVAEVIFEADYRLKMIGIGQLPGGPGVPSVFDLFPKTGEVKSRRMDALRWWLSMKYDAVLHSADRNLFEIKGSAVLCQSENEKISAAGERIHTGKSAAANRLFAANFTAHYSELASQDPVFADLQNIFDLSLVAALLADNRVAERIGWDMGSFAADGAYRTAHYPSPKNILSVVNHRIYGGKDIVVQVAGGVDGQIRKVLYDPHVFRETATLAALQTKGRVPELPEGRWWWDAKSP